MAEFDAIVVGGGTIGAAIAYGLARLGERVAMVDEGDKAFRAARGNFGLVWVQGKGNGYPPYARWTRRSAELWPEFNSELAETTGIDTGYHRPGGLHLCLDEEELQARAGMMADMQAHNDGDYPFEMLDHKAAARRMPGLGPTVAGASYSPMDGHVNPLKLLRALHTGFKRLGGTLVHARIEDVTHNGGGFSLTAGDRVLRAGKLVVAAGLGGKALGEMVGLSIPVLPERGQVLVTERIEPLLQLPTIYMRQTDEGTVLLGDSHEDTGFDDATKAQVMRDIALRACTIFPALKRARIVRAWGALRILTPDGFPVYDQSVSCPGAFSATGHSGVTLAAAHALDFAGLVARGAIPDAMTPLSERRFHVH